MNHTQAFRRVLGVVALSTLGVTLASALPASADPPPWAPAHGWRRKHEGDDEGYRARSNRTYEDDRYNAELQREAERDARRQAERQRRLDRHYRHQQYVAPTQYVMPARRLTRTERERRARHLRRLRRQQRAAERQQQYRYNPLLNLIR